MIDETSALYQNFLVQITALRLSTLAEEIILAHLHAACHTAARAPKFRCRDRLIYLRTTGDAQTAHERIPPFLIAYTLDEVGERLKLVPVLAGLLSNYEEGDADPLLPSEMLETLLDVVSETGEGPDSLVGALERIFDEILGDKGN